MLIVVATYQASKGFAVVVLKIHNFCVDIGVQLLAGRQATSKCLRAYQTWVVLASVRVSTVPMSWAWPFCHCVTACRPCDTQLLSARPPCDRCMRKCGLALLRLLVHLHCLFLTWITDILRVSPLFCLDPISTCHCSNDKQRSVTD